MKCNRETISQFKLYSVVMREEEENGKKVEEKRG